MRAIFYEIFYRFLVTAFRSGKVKMFNACRINSAWLFFCPVLLAFVFALSSCNSITTSKTETGKDSSHMLKLPVLPPVPKEQAGWIYMVSEKWYDQFLKQRGFNGGIIVAKNGHIVFEQYNGTVHIPGRDTISENTPLHIASISKTFTAMAVLKLWQDGKLNIDDELNKYFPQFNYPGVTIRCLLNHRSGLPNYTYFMENLDWDQKRFVTNEDILDFLINRKSELTDITTPCRHFTYCNTNYALLALLIEKVSLKKYADYLKETFFIPLHMDHSFVFSLADTASAAPSYDWRGRLQPFNFLDGVYGDKNIYTTVRDLLTWDRALSSNLLFLKGTLDQAYAPYSNERPGVRNYGLGWRMNIYPNGKKMIYHNGWWHGSNASFIRLLNDTATIILIGNKFNRNIYHAKMLTSIFDSNYSPGNDDEESELFKDLNPLVSSKPDTVNSYHPPTAKKSTGKKPVKKRSRSNKK